MLVSVVYLLFRRALAVTALPLRSREFKELEIVVLRHELAVLRRQVAHPRLEDGDRVFLAAASLWVPKTLIGPELRVSSHRHAGLAPPTLRRLGQ